MTIEDAIEHALNVAIDTDNNQCAKEHLRLANWLAELVDRLEKALNGKAGERDGQTT